MGVMRYPTARLKPNAIMLDVGFINKNRPQTDDLNGIKALYR